MRIAQIAPLHEAVPPKLYGGTERIVAYLTEALIDLGHDVTLFASAGGGTRARQIACRDRPIRLDPVLKSELAAHLTMLERLRERADEFDVIHFHIDLLHMPMFRELAQRAITTLHGRLDIKDLGPFYARFPEYRLVSISHDQRRPLPYLNWIGTVHHGVPGGPLPFTALPGGGYLAFLGRIAPEKRPDRAIAIARQAGVRLKIAAKVDPADRDYFKNEIEPLLAHPLIEYIGEIGDAEKGAFLGNAKALLFPIDWPEPFGLVLIEAMACGTPVIAYRRGSVPEVVDHGVSGLIVDDFDAAVAAVRQIGDLDRRAVRRMFERRFTTDVMARNYLRVYEEVLQPLPSALLAAASPEIAEPRVLELRS